MQKKDSNTFSNHTDPESRDQPENYQKFSEETFKWNFSTPLNNRKTISQDSVTPLPNESEFNRSMHYFPYQSQKNFTNCDNLASENYLSLHSDNSQSHPQSYSPLFTPQRTGHKTAPVQTALSEPSNHSKSMTSKEWHYLLLFAEAIGLQDWEADSYLPKMLARIEELSSIPPCFHTCSALGSTRHRT